jgi:hypothetical protein
MTIWLLGTTTAELMVVTETVWPKTFAVWSFPRKAGLLLISWDTLVEKLENYPALLLSEAHRTGPRGKTLMHIYCAEGC